MNSTAVHYYCLSSSIMTLNLQIWPSHTASFQKALPNLCWKLDSLSITTVRFIVRVWPKNCIWFSQIVILETLMWHGTLWWSRSSSVASPETSASIHPPSTGSALDLTLDDLLLMEIQDLSPTASEHMWKTNICFSPSPSLILLHSCSSIFFNFQHDTVISLESLL